ncbi:restriction endonuclease subunit S [Nocardia sp. NPDC050175]|uniref:restriction endonuclease subunit S n=1 Tax=Nocardia sp. NPDC050175 TaxID=3364317 RepID=UPI0037A95592
MKWTEARLKHLCVDAGQYGLNISAQDYAPQGHRLIRTSDIDELGHLRPRDSAVYVDVSLDARHEIRDGDLLLSRSGTLGRSLLLDALDEPSTYAGYLVRFRPRSDTEPRFMAYVAASKTFQASIEADAVTSTIQNFNAERYANIPVTLPSLDEQRRIADFLDAEVGCIDELVTDQLRVLHLLEERIDSRIMDIVGKSKLADFGGTQSLPLRRLLLKLDRITKATDEVITAFRDGQVTARSVRRSEGYTLTKSAEPQGQGVEVGDVVVHGLDGFAGAIGDSEAIGNCSPVYHVCQPISGGNAQFYGRLLRVLAINGYLGLFASSTRERAVDFRNWALFGNIPVPVVDSKIQHEIGQLVVSVRPLREEVSRFNQRLAERRQALITAAVTGQIDVTTARFSPSGAELA